MANRNVKVDLKVTVSPNADYTDPSWMYDTEEDGLPYEIDPEACERIDNLEIGTAAETLMRTDRYTTLTLFLVKNKDSANYVTLTYTSTSAVALTLRIPAGAMVVVADVNPATAPTLQANTAACLVDIIMAGES